MEFLLILRLAHWIIVQAGNYHPTGIFSFNNFVHYWSRTKDILLVMICLRVWFGYYTRKKKILPTCVNLDFNSIHVLGGVCYGSSCFF